MRALTLADKILLQLGDLDLHNSPDDLKIDSKVIMHNTVSHPDNLLPWDLGRVRLELTGQTIGGFSNDFDVAHHCINGLLVR
ncbi:MAG: hypothetical protein WC655_08485 [Candidatus Hydrogenedentales bacterium]